MERGGRSLQTLPLVDRPAVATPALRALGRLVADGRLRNLQIDRIDGESAATSPFRPALEAAGFRRGYRGWVLGVGRGGAGAMPEGDTLARTASVLREILAGRVVRSARGRPGGPPLERLVGARIERIEAHGKHLLIGASNGLTLHTHLRMHGSWHRYREGERWRRPQDRAVTVIEVPGAVAVCFDAPTVELLDTRALAIHPVLRALGPDLIEPAPDLGEALRRLRDPARAETSIGDALLDQTSQAGLGNVFRSEVCFVESVNPFAAVGSLPDATLMRLLETGHRLLAANRDRVRPVDDPGRPRRDRRARRPAGARVPSLGLRRRRAGPCRRCGTLICSRTAGPLARRVYWCPGCQPPGAGADLGPPD